MLEQIAYEIPRVSEERQTTYFEVGDLESLSASALYTGHLPKMGPGGSFGFGVLPSVRVSDTKPLDIPMYGPYPNPIGSISDFNKEGPGNISTRINLGSLIPEAKDYSLIERYDASHGMFHLNQDVTGINSGTSKKNEDGFKGLGSAHNIDLFDHEYIDKLIYNK